MDASEAKRDDLSQAKSKAERIDRWQQKQRWTAIPFAAVKKFQEDQTPHLAAVVAFWAFFSIFPLLLVLVTLLGFFLPDSTKTEVLKNVAAMFPLLNPQTIGGLTGSWWPLVVGLATALWSGLGVVRTLESAFSAVWEIPMVERPGLKEQTLRGLAALATIGLGLVLSTLISGLVTGTASGLHLGWLGRLVGFVIAIALDVGLFIAAFKWLTDRDVSVKDVLPGAALSGIVFWLLQQLSGFIISNRLQSSSSTYGSFATVITLLWWFYLQGMVTMLGAQINVVLKHQLWPRSLIGGPDTQADHRAYEAYADERTYHENERVDTEFEGQSKGGAPSGEPRR